jgi:hypothetical protein
MTSRLVMSSALLGGPLLVGSVDSGSTRYGSMAPAPLSSEVAKLGGVRARNLGYQMNRLGFTNIGG